MPTGYTNKIANGISFEEFTMNCARAFGALVTMRDESSSVPIPDKFEVSDYHEKQIKENEEELARIIAMSFDERIAGAEKQYRKQMDAKEESIRKANELRQQYNDMLTKVALWIPPTPDHQELKNFMEQQIAVSIKSDCDTSYYEEKDIQLLSGAEWRKTKIERLKKDIEYHKKEHEHEFVRVDGRNKWVQKLRGSLKVNISG